MGLFNFFKDIKANFKNSEMYGTPKDFLRDLLVNINTYTDNFRILVENKGRLKIEFVANKTPFSIDFIYFANYIQVTIRVLSVRGIGKVINCPYNSEEVEDVLKDYIKNFI